jgi:hypothetical protein
VVVVVVAVAVGVGVVVAMTTIAAILLLDAVSILTTYHCFAAMAQGRKAINGELAPVIEPSTIYLMQSDWRR